CAAEMSIQTQEPTRHSRPKVTHTIVKRRQLPKATVRFSSRGGRPPWRA
ncbi:hypothetical protein CSUI_011529, partial [Cystoisospora suis]